MNDRDFLCFLHERLEHKYQESALFDYMHKLRAIIANTPKDQDSRNDGRGKSSLEELKKSLKYYDKNKI